MSSLAQCHRNAFFFLILRLTFNNITWKMPFSVSGVQESLAMGLKVIEDVSNDGSMSQ